MSFSYHVVAVMLSLAFIKAHAQENSIRSYKPILIGVSHDIEQDVILRFVTKFSEHESGLNIGVEGVRYSSGDSQLDPWLDLLPRISKCSDSKDAGIALNLLNGFENLFAYSYTNMIGTAYKAILLNVLDPNNSEEAKDAKWLLLLYLSKQPQFNESWQNLRETDFAQNKIFRIYDQFLRSDEVFDVISARFNMWLDRKENQFSRSEWMEFYKIVALEMTKKIPDRYQAVVRNYLEDPSAESVLYIRDKIRDEWRESFIVPNMKSLIQQSQKKGQRPVFVIGSDHVSHILQQFPPHYFSSIIIETSAQSRSQSLETLDKFIKKEFN